LRRGQIRFYETFYKGKWSKLPAFFHIVQLVKLFQFIRLLVTQCYAKKLFKLFENFSLALLILGRFWKWCAMEKRWNKVLIIYNFCVTLYRNLFCVTQSQQQKKRSQKKAFTSFLRSFIKLMQSCRINFKQFKTFAFTK
jgi:hypothetical protein